MKFKRIFLLSSMVLLSVILGACGNLYVKNYARFYDGPPRSIKEVAIFAAQEDCMISAVRQGGNEKSLCLPKYGGELMPGRYQLTVGYVHSGLYKTTTSKGPVHIEINAQGGHTYFIYPTFPGSDTWQPSVIDIASDEDYLKIKDTFDREWLKNNIATYLSGNRRPLMPSTTVPGTWE
jgi:hypothetical protein